MLRSAFSGAQVAGRPRAALSGKGATGVVMMKKGIHPEWYPEAPVICNGVEVMTVGGTKAQYNVDVSARCSILSGQSVGHTGARRWSSTRCSLNRVAGVCSQALARGGRL